MAELFDTAAPTAASASPTNGTTEGQQSQETSAPKSVVADENFLLFLLGKLELIRSAADHADLYVAFTLGGLTALYKSGAARFHEYLNILADEYSGGDPKAFINKPGFQEVQDFLRAKAHRVAKTRPVFKRTAWLPDDQSLWIDLTHEDAQCIRIDARGWTVDVPSQPLFVRLPTQRPLPTPEPCDDGHAAFLRILPAGISPEHAKLLLGALLGFLIPSNFAAAFSFPILTITGEAGSGKSTLSKTIKTLGDNEVTVTAAKPTKLDDLYVAAQTSHLLSYDNVDFVKNQLSDGLCQLATGSAVVKRRLFTDADLTVLRAHCPVILNGIHPDIPRQDLLDRSITIHLARAPFDPDRLPRVDADLPLVMGYLCDLLSRALANYATTTVANAPRLSLLAKFCAAAEPFGCATPFVELLRANQQDALAASQDNDLVLAALFELVPDATPWTGTYKQLLGTLTSRADDSTTRSPEWPASPHKLARHIREHARLIREQGLDIENGRKSEHGRIVTVRRLTTQPIQGDLDIPF